MMNKTLASIILAAGLASRIHADDVYTFDHFNAERGLYYFIDSNGQYLSVNEKDYKGQKNIVLPSVNSSSSSTSSTGISSERLSLDWLLGLALYSV